MGAEEDYEIRVWEYKLEENAEFFSKKDSFWAKLPGVDEYKTLPYNHEESENVMDDIATHFADNLPGDFLYSKKGKTGKGWPSETEEVSRDRKDGGILIKVEKIPGKIRPLKSDERDLKYRPVKIKAETWLFEKLLEDPDDLQEKTKEIAEVIPSEYPVKKVNVNGGTETWG